MVNVSILILTYNEEANIFQCLASCSWCDDIVVLDSFSTDSTVEIAKNLGARIEYRKFDNYAAQRNFGLHSIQYKYEWVLMLDADERVTPELSKELILKASNTPPETSLYRMRRKDYFFNHWLKRSSGYPTWFGRFVRPLKVRVDREINEEYITDGNTSSLEHHLEHYPFNKGIAWWYERHNRYSSMEAEATLTERLDPIKWTNLISKDPTFRRKTLKRIAYRLPGRPLITFIYLYIFRLGFMDGLGGFYFSLMRASYELMIDIKVIEAQLIKEDKHS